ncbi:hypothetical protein BDFB_005308 [Asbolus verrucosus]|uniref:Uncharacterized protein n=1 Tax=Asbolus verrucosus TaxID=1661398 RepID=A0A482V9W3_ASBVE|nr:hypothetical protein BDFB_005308 [Asbolus verrucosus]
MDAFTENLLTRARERQKMLEGYCDKKPGPLTSSQPNLNSALPGGLSPTFKNSSEGNLSKFSRQSTTRVSSAITSSPNSQKTLNIHNDNFNMEIKVSSADNVRVEVQIEEQQESDEGDGGRSEGGLRQDAKNRLNRLGKLYAGGEDADISSPIHRTETKFHADDSPVTAKPTPSGKNKRGLSKLADLARNINEFEDDLTSVPRDKGKKPQNVKKSWKPPAPQPPEVKKSSPVRPSTKAKAPSPPKIVKETSKPTTPVNWDKKVLDSLESQGFTRTESSSRLVYKYGAPQEVKVAETAKIAPSADKENVIMEEKEPEEPPKPKSPLKNVRSAIADKAALFESSPSRGQKDPALLSVSERKALFERNKGAALVPKAPFAMATPIKSEPPKEKVAKAAASVPPPQGGGIASKVAALFEGKTTISQEQIESGVREQRRKEMDVLLNRFHKPMEMAVEESEDHEEATEETAMISERPSKIVPSEKGRHSGNKRCSKGDSPKVAAVLSDVKRIKVSPQKAGRLYPSLTDIESVTENETDTRSPTPANSSFEGSFAESEDANTSFGRDILRTVCKNQAPQKRLSCMHQVKTHVLQFTATKD